MVPGPATSRCTDAISIITRDLHQHPGPRGPQWGLVVENILEVLVAFVLILSVFLLGASIYSYRVTGNRKMLFVMGAFILFTVKGVLMSLTLFTDVIDIQLDESLVLIDLFILITLYLVTMTK